MDQVDRINDLINLAQSLLDSGFDVQTFLNWETAAFLALVSLLGPFHFYTQNFKRLTSDNTPMGLLTGAGILMAAREEAHKAFQRIKAGKSAPFEHMMAPAPSYQTSYQRTTP